MKEKIAQATALGSDLFEQICLRTPNDGTHFQGCYAAAAALVYLVVSNNQQNTPEESLKNLQLFLRPVTEMIAAQKNAESSSAARREAE